MKAIITIRLSVENIDDVDDLEIVARTAANGAKGTLADSRKAAVLDAQAKAEFDVSYKF